MRRWAQPLRSVRSSHRRMRPPPVLRPSFKGARLSNGSNALVRLGRESQASQSDIAAVRQGLSDNLPAARARAAQAAGALGSLAAAAAPQLLNLLSDTSADVVREVAFALGVLRERNERVLRALFRAAVSRSAAGSGAPAVLAIMALGRYPLVPVSASLSDELRLNLHSQQPPVRSASVRTAMRTDVAWARSEFTYCWPIPILEFASTPRTVSPDSARAGARRQMHFAHSSRFHSMGSRGDSGTSRAAGFRDADGLTR